MIIDLDAEGLSNDPRYKDAVGKFKQKYETK